MPVYPGALTYRMARLLVKEILGACLLVLMRDYELKTPFGELRIATAPKQRKHRAFGRLVKTYRRNLWVRFRPAADLKIRALNDDDAGENEADAKEEDLEMGESKPVKCPRCKGTWLMEGHFRRYMETYGSTPGSDIQAFDDAEPFDLLVCLCGQPTGPRLRGGRQDVQLLKDFRANVKKAQQYLKQQAEAVDEGVKRVLLKLASQEKQEQLLTRLSNVEAGLKNLGWDVTDEL